MSPRVRFEDEADAEYRHAGRWYEGRRTGFPYHVFYLETAEQIRILAVAHDRRKPGYWKSRL